MAAKRKLAICLWFDRNAEAAVRHYKSIFRDLEVGRVSRYVESEWGEKGSVLTIAFRLFGRDFLALNGGPYFKFTEAVSIIVPCETQREIDYYWKRLTAGGEASECGWLKDKFGLSWQVVPSTLGKMVSERDEKKVSRLMKAIHTMKKLDKKKLEEAFHGK